MKQATTISDPPELKRVKENQKNISNVWSLQLSYFHSKYRKRISVRDMLGEFA